MKKKLIAEITTGEREIAGTRWPIETQIHREQYGGSRPKWVVTFNLCNGVPCSSRTFLTKKEALLAAGC